MDLYLSIDLDYFRTIPEMTKYLTRVLKYHPKPYICTRHHTMLRDINHYRPDIVYNIDCHSDLAEDEFSHPTNEGTWGNFVKGSRRLFYWIFPDYCCAEGKSNSDGSDCCYCNHQDGSNPFLAKDPSLICGWKKVSKRLGRIPNPAKFNHVGICLSPEWSSPEIIQAFKQFRREKRF